MTSGTENTKENRQPDGLPGAQLPEAFLVRMRRLLGSEYEPFFNSYGKNRTQGLRLNPLKGPLPALLADCGERFGLSPVPWCPEGFYYELQTRPGRHPFHEAGVYYIQEPSAMAAAALLAPQPGEKVLDLCAAPGGKTTHIASRMAGRGLLMSNEIHPARAKILSQNVERMGIRSCLVMNETPPRLAKRFPGYFDRVLVDAPCSGEGMFRKDKAARGEWSPEHVRACAARQQEILESAAALLKPGGRLLYSTCTFAPEEDEAGIAAFLLRHPEFSVAAVPEEERPAGLSPGRADWGSPDGTELPEKIRSQLSLTLRIWPHLAGGEGHFFALLRKQGDPEPDGSRKPGPELPAGDSRAGKQRSASGGRARREPDKKRAVRECLDGILKAGAIEFAEERLTAFGDQIYLLPEGTPELSGLRVLRPGLHLGTMKKDRMEPAHALALALGAEEVCRVYPLSAEGPEIFQYLAGGTLPADGSVRGWMLVTAGGYSVGWGKAAGGALKNHYPKGLRIPCGNAGH